MTPIPWVKKTDNEPEHYWECDLTPAQRLALLDLLRGQAHKVPSSLRRSIEDAVQDSRRMELPLRRDRLDWGEIEASARRQGVGVTDVLYDRMGHGKHE